MRLLLFTALVAAGVAPATAADRCSKITDAAARLACYDNRFGAPPVPAAPPLPEAAPAPVAAAPRIDRRAAKEERRAARDEHHAQVAAARPAPPTADSRIVSITVLRHGYYRLTLADGDIWDTTQIQAPPSVGQAVHLRRTVMGTTFVDIHGRAPITVRRAPKAG